MKKIKFYGFAGHFINSAKCAYHLATNIDNKILISTVGHYILEGKLSKINLDSYYESFVFSIDGEDYNGNPIQGELLESIKTDGSIEAEKTHYLLLDKYINGEEVKIVFNIAE